MNENQEREAFEAWWPTVGQTIGKVAAWESWQARAALADKAPTMLQGEDPRIEAVRNVVERLCGTRWVAENFARRILAAADSATPAPAPEAEPIQGRAFGGMTLEARLREQESQEMAERFDTRAALEQARKDRATPAQAQQAEPLTDGQIDMATDHLYCDGRPVPAKYRVALGRIVERAHGIGANSGGKP